MEGGGRRSFSRPLCDRPTDRRPPSEVHAGTDSLFLLLSVSAVRTSSLEEAAEASLSLSLHPPSALRGRSDDIQQEGGRERRKGLRRRRMFERERGEKALSYFDRDRKGT